MLNYQRVQAFPNVRTARASGLCWMSIPVVWTCGQQLVGKKRSHLKSYENLLPTHPTSASFSPNSTDLYGRVKDRVIYGDLDVQIILKWFELETCCEMLWVFLSFVGFCSIFPASSHLVIEGEALWQGDATILQFHTGFPERFKCQEQGT